MGTIDSQPLVLVFTLGQLDDFSQTATAQSCFGELLKLPAVCALLRLVWPEGAPRAGIGVTVVGKNVSHDANLVKTRAQPAAMFVVVIATRELMFLFPSGFKEWI